jgi:putative transposase
LFKKSDGLLREGVVVRYGFIEAHRGCWPVRLMCQVLGVAPGGYYGWRGRPVSPRTQRREALVDAIEAVHVEVKARYGSPRIHVELAARGQACCVNTVARLMRRHGIAAKTKRKSRCTTDSNHDRPVAENVVGRQFEPEAPNQVWTADIRFIRQKRAPTQVKVQSYPDGYPTRAYLVSWIARIFNLKNSGSRKP